jgi:hypothetical protein
VPMFAVSLQVAHCPKACSPPCPQPEKADIRVVERSAGFGPLPPKACNPPCPQPTKADKRVFERSAGFDPKLIFAKGASCKRWGHNASRIAPYSITSSAIASIPGGMSTG